MRLFLAFLCAALLSTSSASAENRVALVIGNDRYANLPALGKAVNDAEAVGDRLTRLGFEVIRGRDLGRQAMIDRIAEFTARIEPGDTALFFYAGHGVAIGGVNYLVPSDAPTATPGAEARVRGASIPEGDIIAEVQARGARVAILVLDACRDNPFPRAGTRTIGNTRGLADAKPARGVFTIYSAGIGQTALDGLYPTDPNRNSVFTRVFIDQLTKPVHLGELAVEVREKVAEMALKEAKNRNGEPAPHEQTPAYYDQTIGGRVFIAGLPTARPEQQKTQIEQRVQPLASDEVFWFSIRDSRVAALFEEFLKSFPESRYAAEARARLNEVKNQSAAVVPLAPPPVAPPAPAPKPAVGISPDARIGPEQKSVVKKTLGLELAELTADVKKHFKVNASVRGVVITSVEPGSSAAENRLVAGDVIVEIAQEPVTNAADAQRRVEQLQKEDKKSALMLVAKSSGELRFVALKLQ